MIRKSVKRFSEKIMLKPWIALSLRRAFAQKQGMTDNSDPRGALRRFASWATTPPQAYGVYLAAVVLVFLLSFYAGAMKPKKTPENVSPPVSAPQR